ncbi:hypothetical protein SLS64_006294 [Diaporthe eres]|uniref:MFS general substrate transporter n=1 Tax=Diaporthe eres TaxID=83184 RepID=A0ABR1NW17_DIAER
MGLLNLPQLRYRSPWVQNIISGICVGASAGMYIALNLLGAGGGRPDSAQVVQVVNATLCSVWFFSSSFGGSILNKLGPGITMCIGVQTYVVYVGSLWYYDETGLKGYPYAAGPIIGIGAGMVFITAGYISTAYPEEREKGSFATMLMNMQALGSVIGGIIPLIINRNSSTVAGVPRSVYIAFIVIMIIGGLCGLLLLRPQDLRRDDGSVVAVHPPRGAWAELKSNLMIFTDPVLLIMVPAFFPSEGFLVYSGSVNGQNSPPTDPTDWDEPRFGWIFILFMLNWVFSQLWHNIVYYWIGAITNSPQKLTHYVGVFRGVLGAGEAICFGLDSIKIPFIAEAGGILLFYAIGICSFYYLGIYHIKDTNYDHREEGAVIPNHVLEGMHVTDVPSAQETGKRDVSVSQENAVEPEKIES